MIASLRRHRLALLLGVVVALLVVPLVMVATSGASAPPSQALRTVAVAAGSPAMTPDQPSAATADIAGSHSPADVAAAAQAVDRYTRALIEGNYATAFSMLAVESQQDRGSLAAYTTERAPFFESVKGLSVVTPWPTNVGSLADWLPETHGAEIALEHAVLVEAAYPALAGNNAGIELFIVAPGPRGLVLYHVR